MPELPEVENVRLSLEKSLKPGVQLESVKFLRPDLRFPIPTKKIKSLVGKNLTGLRRRAKYLIFDFGSEGLVSHLGMTGQWRIQKVPSQPEKHEHAIFTFSNGVSISYLDPRRFGYLDFLKLQLEKAHPFFAELGVEPLAPEFDAGYLQRFLKGKSAPIKTALLDQKGVVGLGNIYVCEALFKVGVRPQRKAGSLKLAELESLVQQIKIILKAAIEQGGSSIRDYRNSENLEGSFQSQHLVYGREGELCVKCHSRLKNLRLAGRSSFWCPSCQR